MELKIYPESQEQKWERIRRNLLAIKETAMQEARGTLNLRIFVTHNFFVEKIALELLEMLTTTTSDGEIR